MRRIATVLFLLAVLAPLGALAQGGLPDCIEVTSEARWAAAAYNHYVRVTNGCDRLARCRVATDVNPEAQSIEVRPGASVEVITFRGSPASRFTPHVTCDLVR